MPSDTRIVVVALDELRSLIEEALRLAPQVARDEWVDARTSGLGRRVFLRLGHEGAFPIFRRGRTYVAKRSDVDSYIERQRVPVDPPPTPEPSRPSSLDPIAAALAEGRLRIVKKPP